MRSTFFIVSAAAAALSATAAAQAQSRTARVDRDGAPRATTHTVRAAADPAAASAGDPLASLGIAAATSGSDRDTLGLLISTVTPGGPADRAGVDAGSRLAEVNGVSLRSSGDDGSTDAMSRKVERALQATKPGADVALRLYRAGHFRVVSVTPPPGLAPVASVPGPTPEPRLTIAPAPVVPAAPRAEVAAPAMVAVAAPAGSVSLSAVIESTVQTQAQLGRLVAQEEAVDGPLLDSLAVMQQELRTLQRRLRGLQSRASRTTPKPADAAAATTESEVPLDGLKLGAVSDELVAYYGEGSDAGQLVLQADAAWAPLHAGDVILKVDDAPVTSARLHAASISGGRLDVLRRRRVVAVTLPPRE